ncbi:MAG: CRISPR-associated endonuclease Cas2 [Zetaproteobacteria bacterium]|nr:MAG: CRISPR-associated endonuclease Cas2 [Zetaproteobacteria bacterium]
MGLRLYLVGYDIARPERLRKMHALVKQHAYGGQKSVFECWMTEDERDALIGRAARLVDAREDRFFVLALDAAAKPQLLGLALPPQSPHFFYHG